MVNLHWLPTVVAGWLAPRRGRRMARGPNRGRNPFRKYDVAPRLGMRAVERRLRAGLEATGFSLGSQF